MSISAGVRPKSPTERMLAGNAWLVYAFFYAPILVLIVFSFNENNNVGIWTEPSLRWYRDVLANDAVMSAIRVSLIVAAISTVVSTILGTMTALSLERFRYRGRRAFDGLVYLPIIIPDVTMAVMLLLFFAQSFQWLDAALGWRPSFGIATISLSHIAFNISFVAVVVRARLGQLDARLEEAAADLYATRWQAFRRVTFPLIAPGVVGGALLALTLSLDDVVVTSFVAGPGSTTLPVYVFGLVRRGVTPLINAVSTLMLVASMVLIAISLGFQRTSRSRVAIREQELEPN
jgi:spermidine/putrescine transport system permease protein